MSLGKLATGVMVAFVGMLFIVNVTPTIESSVVSANVTNAFVSSMIDMAAWLLPIGGIMGIFYGIFHMFTGSNGSS